METKICISKNAINSDNDLNITIFYLHPKITITVNTKYTEFSKCPKCSDMSYTYIGTLETILNSNDIDGNVNVEYFIMGMSNTNDVDISENILIFSFPLQINYVNNIVNIACARVYDEKNRTDDKALVELTSKYNELSNKYEEIKLEVAEMRKNTHVDASININIPICFSNYTTSIHILNRSRVYTHKLILPTSLLYLYLGNGDYPSIDFPPNLLGLHLETLMEYNHPINIPDIVEELKISGLKKYDHPLDLPKSLKVLHLTGLIEFTHSIDIPEGVEEVRLSGLMKYNSVIIIPCSVTKLEISPCNQDDCPNFGIKCLSRCDEVVLSLLTVSCNMYFPRMTENEIKCTKDGNTVYYINQRKSLNQISFSNL